MKDDYRILKNDNHRRGFKLMAANKSQKLLQVQKLYRNKLDGFVEYGNTHSKVFSAE